MQDGEVPAAVPVEATSSAEDGLMQTPQKGEENTVTPRSAARKSAIEEAIRLGHHIPSSPAEALRLQLPADAQQMLATQQIDELRAVREAAMNEAKKLGHHISPKPRGSGIFEMVFSELDELAKSRDNPSERVFDDIRAISEKHQFPLEAIVWRLLTQKPKTTGVADFQPQSASAANSSRPSSAEVPELVAVLQQQVLEQRELLQEQSIQLLVHQQLHQDHEQHLVEQAQQLELEKAQWVQQQQQQQQHTELGQLTRMLHFQTGQLAGLLNQPQPQLSSIQPQLPLKFSDYGDASAGAALQLMPANGAAGGANSPARSHAGEQPVREEALLEPELALIEGAASEPELALVEVPEDGRTSAGSTSAASIASARNRQQLEDAQKLDRAITNTGRSEYSGGFASPYVGGIKTVEDKVDDAHDQLEIVDGNVRRLSTQMTEMRSLLEKKLDKVLRVATKTNEYTYSSYKLEKEILLIS
jgi:hypothetical protein